MFRSRLHVVHIDGNRWELTRPLVWEAKRHYYIVREGFITDFASIPRPVRWLLDNAGGDSEAAVLHDAVWRESQRGVHSRVDPWNADLVFRRALRQTGSPALPRVLMWFAVRANATLRGRFGGRGPRPYLKVLELLGILLVGVVAALGPTIVAAIGLGVFWLTSWVVSAVWWFYEHRRRHSTNWPWPWHRRPHRAVVGDNELLMIVDKYVTLPSSDGGVGPTRIPLAEVLESNPDITGDQLEAALAMASN
jgi:hypothetical protein